VWERPSVHAIRTLRWIYNRRRRASTVGLPWLTRSRATDRYGPSDRPPAHQVRQHPADSCPVLSVLPVPLRALSFVNPQPLQGRACAPGKTRSFVRPVTVDGRWTTALDQPASPLRTLRIVKGSASPTLPRSAAPAGQRRVRCSRGKVAMSLTPCGYVLAPPSGTLIDLVWH
jgi:hypothetical protein